MQPRIFNFDFLSKSRIFAISGVVLAILVVISTATRGINWSVDFAGGTEIEVDFAKDINESSIRDAAGVAGVNSMLIQAVSGGQHRYLLRFENVSAGEDGNAQTQIQAFRETFVGELAQYEPEVLRTDFVGPQIGKELQQQGAASVFYAVLGVFIYILLRFDMRFGPGAVVKMILDVFIIIGFYTFGWISFDLTSVAALLTVVGYSVNDTIVIYDRIRENLVLHPKRTLRESINFSLNETLTRTLNTSVTTIIALAGILVFGTAQIWNFAAAMAIGVIAATLSSMFLASSFVLWSETWRKTQRKVA